MLRTKILFALFNVFLYSFPVFSAVEKPSSFFSQYTSLAAKDCVTLDADSLYKNPEIDFYHGECPGLSGYRVFMTGGDLRYHVELSFNGSPIKLVSPPEFHSAGVKAEWRFQRFSEKIDGSIQRFSAEPIALIYRLVVDEDHENNTYSAPVDRLIVVRLKGAASCVIGQIKASDKMNLEAQKLADNLSSPCLQN